jgi:hypothetical protein
MRNDPLPLKPLTEEYTPPPPLIEGYTPPLLTEGYMLLSPQLQQYLQSNSEEPYYNFRSYDVTSCDVTFGHVTSGSHATFGHEQWYILYYYYSKKKTRGCTSFFMGYL